MDVCECSHVRIYFKISYSSVQTHDADVSAALRDASQIVSAYTAVIARNPKLVYVTALALAPSRYAISTQYIQLMSSPVRISWSAISGEDGPPDGSVGTEGLPQTAVQSQNIAEENLNDQSTTKKRRKHKNNQEGDEFNFANTAPSHASYPEQQQTATHH